MAKNILIIGGTRNLGHFTAMRMLEAGHRVTVLNRGMSDDDLPENVARLRCDRTDRLQMRRALQGRQFDMVIDTVVYKGEEAETIVETLRSSVGHYVFISTGQVYLVRENLTRPFKEEDYDGPVMPMPDPNSYDYEEWLYGADKRAAEDVFAQAHAEDNFPYTSLRLPMVNSERDTFHRLYGYMLRIKDGGPILVPETPDLPLRHIYGGDVVEVILHLLNSGQGKGRAYNIAQEEVITLHDFLHLLGDLLGMTPNIRMLPREVLNEHGFLPDCSPFSDVWMSTLDNSRSKTELGMVYTPLRTYLEKIVSYYEAHPPAKPIGYHRRRAEKHLDDIPSTSP
ncbi:MAG: NAD-dependent epimerase/dehydratase family protein [Anaerolineae bacterium]